MSKNSVPVLNFDFRILIFNIQSIEIQKSHFKFEGAKIRLFLIRKTFFEKKTLLSGKKIGCG